MQNHKSSHKQFTKTQHPSPHWTGPDLPLPSRHGSAVVDILRLSSGYRNKHFVWILHFFLSLTDESQELSAECLFLIFESDSYIAGVTSARVSVDRLWRQGWELLQFWDHPCLRLIDHKSGAKLLAWRSSKCLLHYSAKVWERNSAVQTSPDISRNRGFHFRYFSDDLWSRALRGD